MFPWLSLIAFCICLWAAFKLPKRFPNVKHQWFVFWIEIGLAALNLGTILYWVFS